MKVRVSCVLLGWFFVFQRLQYLPGLADIRQVFSKILPGGTMSVSYIYLQPVPLLAPSVKVSRTRNKSWPIIWAKQFAMIEHAIIRPFIRPRRTDAREQAVRDGFERRENPAVQLKRIDEAFQLPDVGFCFEGDTYGSRFACFDEADGEDCAGSLQGDAFVYGYNYTGYTTPDDYPVSDDYIVLFPDFLSSTCRRFRLSNLTATDSSAAWRFHMLMFWTSEYNATLNPGAFESVKMYLYDGGLTAEQISDTPITLYAPMSFDASEVPFVRGFLEYEMRVMLDQSVENTYTVVDTTASDWHNAEDAVYLAKKFDTDSVASIQLDVRRLTYLRYEEIDPMDVIGTIGEISGFWLVVPLLFGLLFHRPAAENEEQRSFRGLGCCKSRSQVQQPRTDFSVRRWTSEVTRNG